MQPAVCSLHVVCSAAQICLTSSLLVQFNSTEQGRSGRDRTKRYADKETDS